MKTPKLSTLALALSLSSVPAYENVQAGEALDLSVQSVTDQVTKSLEKADRNDAEKLVKQYILLIQQVEYYYPLYKQNPKDADIRKNYIAALEASIAGREQIMKSGNQEAILTVISSRKIDIAHRTALANVFHKPTIYRPSRRGL